MSENLQIVLNQISQKFKPLSNFDIEKISKKLNISNGTIINLDSEGIGFVGFLETIQREKNFSFF